MVLLSWLERSVNYDQPRQRLNAWSSRTSATHTDLGYHNVTVQYRLAPQLQCQRYRTGMERVRPSVALRLQCELSPSVNEVATKTCFLWACHVISVCLADIVLPSMEQEEQDDAVTRRYDLTATRSASRTKLPTSSLQTTEISSIQPLTRLQGFLGCM
jgi:hypothetical protein